MPYEFYKVMHLVAAFVFVSGAGILLLADQQKKFWKITTGVASFLILVAGFGLLARLGMTDGLPSWAIAKIVVWLIATGLGHMVAKRFPKYGFPAYWATIGLAMVAAILGVYKP